MTQKQYMVSVLTFVSFLAAVAYFTGCSTATSGLSTCGKICSNSSHMSKFKDDQLECECNKIN